MARRPTTRKSNADDPEEPKPMTENVAKPEEQRPQPTFQGERAPANHIFVGKKPVMSYAMSALIQLTQMGDIVVKARGLAISRAVDVAEIVTKRLGNGVYLIKDIRIDTEQVGEGADLRNISSIEIMIAKK